MKPSHPDTSKRLSFRPAAPLAILAGGIAAASALAAPVDSPTATPLQLKRLSLEELTQVKVATVTTATKRPEKTTDVPGTVIVIDKRDIELRGYSSLKDVLRDVPGMDLSENFFSELGTQVGVRGITGNNKIVVLVNGMRVNPPGGEYFPFRNDFSVRNAEQIEIIYGPGSTLYGQDAISAVINVKTKQPPADGRASGEVGGHVGLNREREAWGSFGKVFDSARNILFNGYVQYHDSSLSRIDREYPDWWEGYKRAAKPRGRGTLPERKDYGLNAFAQLQIGDFSIQSWFRDSERSSSEGYGPPALGFLREARWEDRSWVTEAKHVWKITDSATLTSAVTYNWFEIDPHSRYVFPRNDQEWFFNDFKYGTGNSLNVEETLRIEFSKSLSVLLGGVYSNYDIIPKSTVPGKARRGSDDDLIRQAGSFVYYTVPGDPASRTEIPRVVEVDFARYGAYLEFAWQITPKLKLVAGGRVDKDTRIDEPSYTPRASLIYDVTDAFTAKYTYSEAYISPAPYFGFATYDRGDILNTSNPNLQPETSKTHELSFTYNKEAYNLGLSLYYGEQSNLILVSDVGLAPNVLRDPVFIDLVGTQPRKLTNSVNSGTSMNAGLDFYGRAKLAHNFSTWFSYSYTTYEESTAGMTFGLKGISQHNFRLGATWAITPQLFVTPSLVGRSTPRNVHPGRLRDELENPLQVNLHILFTPKDYLEFYVDLRNITDNHYATTAFLPEALPQETFSGVIGARLSF